MLMLLLMTMLQRPTPPPKAPSAGSHTMSRLDPERSGLPKRGPKTDETSFIKGETSGRVMTAKDMATIEVEEAYPNMDKRKVEV